MPRITFDAAQTVSPADPNRMDVACFIGFEVQRTSDRLPDSLMRWLTNNHWMSRVSRPGTPLQYDLLDVPVPIESWEMYQSLFAGEQRLDGKIKLAGNALADTITLQPDDAVLHVAVDGVVTAVPLPNGSLPPADVAAAINAAQAGITARIAEISIEEIKADESSPEGVRIQKHLVIAHAARALRGRLTVFANPSLGFPRAMNAANGYVDTYLSVAVRSFFAQGGRKCYVVRMGDPLPLDASEGDKLGRLAGLIWGDEFLWRTGRQLQDLLEAGLPLFPSRAEIQENWHGIAHIMGLADVSYISLPDLPDLLSAPPEPQAPLKSKSSREVFVPCTPAAAGTASTFGLRWQAPRCSETGFRVWARLISYLQRFVAANYREMQLIASLPLPHQDMDQDLHHFLQESSWFGAAAGGEKITGEFLQLGFPWLKTADAAALPGGVEPPEGALGGLLAANALTKGAYRSAAGVFVRRAYDLLPPQLAGFGAGPADGTPPLSERISMFVWAPGGIQLDSDVTTSADPYYRHGAVRRLMALIVRLARHQGWSTVFEPQSTLTWQAVEKNISTILAGIYEAGGLRGRTPEEAFSVTCDRSTMTPNDIDQGRLIANISVWPAVPIERIKVMLMLEDGGPIVLRSAA
jgi:hypothetical protein